MIDATARAIGRRADDGPALLSFGQELVWLMDRASPGITAWKVSRAYRLEGTLDIPALQTALDALVARHAALRTLFVPTEAGPRAIAQPPQPVPIERVDLSDYAEHGPAEAERLARERARTPFDLAHEAPFRVMLVQLGPQDWLLSLDSHHIVSDAWTQSIVTRELAHFYAAYRRGVPAELPPLPLEFADFAAWERAGESAGALQPSLAYWREQLSGVAASLALPTDRPRAAAPRFAGAGREAILPHELLEQLRALARDHDATLYMVLLAGFATLMQRYSGADDVVVGSPIAGRTHSETEGVVGYFANTLVLRVRFEDDPSFDELLARVRSVCLGAYEHQQVPAEQLVLALQKERQLTQAPLFQVILTMEDTLPNFLSLDGLDVRPLEVDPGATKFDWTLRIREQSDGLRLSLWYRTDLFFEATADRLLGHLQTLLAAAVAEPGRRCRELPILGETERHALLAEYNGRRGPIGPAAVHVQFEAAARRAPTAVAVIDDEREWTYAEIDAAAARLTGVLLARGVEAAQPIGLGLSRSGVSIAALLGVLHAGGAYVPLDPELPPERLAAIVSESGLRVVVTEPALQGRFKEAGVDIVLLPSEAGEPASERGAGLAASNAALQGGSASPAAGTVPLSLDSVAYILFTSGSTGVPKGVAVTHRNLLNYTTGISARLGVSGTEPWSFATVSPLWVDLGNTAIFPALCSGGTLHVIGADVAVDASRLGERMQRGQIDVLKITPTHLGALADGGNFPAVLPRRWLVLGGEACPWTLAQRAARSGACAVLNHYGPTETTVGACTFVLGQRDFGDARPSSVPIGAPLPNVRCYVLDPAGGLVPLGIPGELCIGGVGVAQGYVNRPAQTAERFVPDPFAADAGARLYRTGDRVRRLAGGDLEFLGRLDDQVKLRGFRVELGDVESVLAGCPGVGRAAAVVRTTGRTTRLVAYADGGSPGGALTEAALREWAQARLPDYMVPDVCVVVDGLPLGPSGKVDRNALPDPGTGPASGTQLVAPRTPTEQRIAEIWASLLGVERIGVTANFLALGFHSILAIRGLNELGRAFGIRVPLRSFFDSPTVAQLAAVVDTQVRAAEEVALERALAEVDARDTSAAERR